MTKRRLTQKAVAHSTQSGAPAARIGSEASCAVPANTVSDISSASQTSRPLCTIATPVTMPQAAMPGANGAMSATPRRNCGSCVRARRKRVIRRSWEI
jgi:hypothetical protein